MILLAFIATATLIAGLAIWEARIEERKKEQWMDRKRRAELLKQGGTIFKL